MIPFISKLWCKLRGCHNWHYLNGNLVNMEAPCQIQIKTMCLCGEQAKGPLITVKTPHVHKWSRGYKNPHIGTSAYGHMPYIKHCTLDECIAIAPVKRRKVAKELP